MHQRIRDGIPQVYIVYFRLYMVTFNNMAITKNGKKSRHDRWIKALMEDYIKAVTSYFATEDDKSRFVLPESWIWIMTVDRAWSLVAVCGWIQVFGTLHQASIDALQVDGLGNNVIHTLVRHAPDSQVHGANMGSIWGRQDPGGPHVGPMNFAIWSSRHPEREQYYFSNGLFVTNTRTKNHQLLLKRNTTGPYKMSGNGGMSTDVSFDDNCFETWVCVTKQAYCGTFSVDYYDVTEYESHLAIRQGINGQLCC